MLCKMWFLILQIGVIRLQKEKSILTTYCKISLELVGFGEIFLVLITF